MFKEFLFVTRSRNYVNARKEKQTQIWRWMIEDESFFIQKIFFLLLFHSYFVLEVLTAGVIALWAQNCCTHILCKSVEYSFNPKNSWFSLFFFVCHLFCTVYLLTTASAETLSFWPVSTFLFSQFVFLCHFSFVFIVSRFSMYYAFSVR